MVAIQQFINLTIQQFSNGSNLTIQQFNNLAILKQMEEKLPEILSEEVQEVMSSPPKSIIRYGITIVFIIFCILLTGSWFVKYPDIINAEIIVSSNTIPVSLVSKANGKITHLFVNNEQIVEKFQILAVLENPTNYEDALLIDSIIQQFDINNIEHIEVLLKLNSLTLGELQQSFQNFQQKCSEYYQYLIIDFYRKKDKSLRNQLVLSRQYSKQLVSQVKLQKEELNYSENEFKRDSILFSKNLISASEYDKSSKVFLQQKSMFENANTGQTRYKMEVSQLEQQIVENELGMQEKTAQYKNSIEMTKNSISNSINNWKTNYLITTPISGKVSFTSVREINQNVKAGDIVFSVVPLEKSKILGIMSLPMQGSGKVKVGQNINIKFDNYPHIEFGMVKGTVKMISLVPIESNYIVEVEFNSGLTTNYGKELELSQQMSGLAEIITEDIRLLERVFNPLKAILKRHD